MKQVLIAVLGVIAIAGIFSWPMDDSSSWALDFVLAKAVGCGAAWAAYKISRSDVAKKGGEL